MLVVIHLRAANMPLKPLINTARLKEVGWGLNAFCVATLGADTATTLCRNFFRKFGSMFTHIFRAFIFVFAITLFSCKKDAEILIPDNKTKNDTSKTSLVFKFEVEVNGQSLMSNSQWFTLANGDSFTVSKFNYYISNIKLKRDDGTIFSETESYHLNQHLENITSFAIQNVPFGTYTQIEFEIGVDSLRNHSGAQVGALDIGNGMFWTWNSGYIFFKLEGDYKTQSMTEKSDYAFHIGTDELLKKCSFNLSTNITAKKDKQSVVTFNANIAEALSETDFETVHAVSGGKHAAIMADNYKKMFSVTKVEN